MGYNDIKLDTPKIFENTKPNSRVLIIGSGHSTSEILTLKNKIKKKFDVIIACNKAFQFFDDIIDFHLITEKTSLTSTNKLHQSLNEKKYRTDVPRILNWKGIDLYDKRYNIVKTTRSNFDYKCNIRKYSNDKYEGLLIGPVGKQKFSIGSVMLSSMHFSAILGASEVYLIGADLCFKDEFDHFYKDMVYRNIQNGIIGKNLENIIKVSINGTEYETTEYMKESAEYIDKVIPTLFKDIKIFDFSDGLLSKPCKINIREFLGC